MTDEIRRILTKKEERRRALAALPFEEKVRLLVRMQVMIAPIQRAKGRSVRIWPLQTESKTR